MARPGEWQYRLERAFSRADLGAVSLLEAARLLDRAVPDYTLHRYEYSASDAEGVRWFDAPQLAIAHAIWTATHQPYDPGWRVVDVVGQLTLSKQGLWSTQVRLPLRHRPRAMAL
ncbi:MAG TPA: hypothetical protein VM687_14050 [Stenotrophomonas sp.]|nr:hypothetical protein [Stenotrophomonas sp.]